MSWFDSLVKVSTLLSSRESFRFDDVRYSFFTFSKGIGLVVSFTLCYLSSRPLSLLALSLRIPVGEWGEADSSLVFLPPATGRQILPPWNPPFDTLQEFPATVPANGSLQMCAAFVSRSSDKLLAEAARQRNAARQAAEDPISQFHTGLSPIPGMTMILCARSHRKSRSFRVRARFQPLSSPLKK